MIPDHDPTAALQAFFRLMTMNGGVRAFHAARASGLLDALGADPRSVDALAEACAMQPRPVLLMLRVLAALGLTREVAGGFVATPLVTLLTGPYAALSDSYWEHLPQYLMSAEPLCQMDDPTEAEAHYVREACSLDWMMRGAAAALAELLAPHLPQAARVLDVGAGAGTWGFALLAARPDARGVALDRPAVLDVAKGNAARLGLSERVEWLAGDFFACPAPVAAADLVILANVCHGLTPERIACLLDRVRAWLAAGGRLVLVDVLEVAPAATLTAALYELGLALRTRNGQVHSRQVLTNLLVAAGFAAPECIPLPGEPGMMAALLTTVA